MQLETETGSVDFFISRSGSDKLIAQHVAHALEDGGRYRVVIQDWDFGSRSFVADMDDALQRAKRVIVILSNRYLESIYCTVEWQTVFANDPKNFGERLILLRVEAGCRPKGILRTLPYTDLFKVPPASDSFRQVVLRRVSGDPPRTPSSPFIVRPDCILGEGFTAAPNFVACPEAEAAIHAALDSPRPGSAVRVVAIVGPPGIGKTALALRYGFQERERYAGVWRIGADCEEAVIDSLVQLGETLLPELGRAPDRRNAARLALALAASNTDRPWLLILDDLRDESLYRRWVSSAGVDAILTSRNPITSRTIQRTALRPWPEDVGAKFLLEESGRDDLTVADAKAIARALDGLPLALSHAAAFLRDNIAETATLYLANIAARMREAASEADYPRSVAATLSSALTVARLSAPLVHEIASLAACFGAHDISVELLTVALAGPGSAEATKEDEQTSRAVSALCRLSLASFDSGRRSVSVSTLTQTVLLHEMGAEAPTWFEKATIALNFLLTPPDFESWRRWESLMPHVRSLIQKRGLLNFPFEDSEFLSKVAEYAYARGDFAYAEAIYRHLLEQTRQNELSEPLALAGWLGNLGSVLVATDRLAEARPLLEASAQIEQRELGDNDPAVVPSLSNLGCLLHAIGETDAAKSLLSEAIQVVEGTSGQGPLLATLLANLAGVFKDCHEIEEAERLFRRALLINENSLETDDPAVGTDLQNLSDLLADTGRPDEARTLQGRAVEILAKHLPPGHPKLLWALRRARAFKEGAIS
jgi:tetratricopeptide (TPR) repeat protein